MKRGVVRQSPRTVLRFALTQFSFSMIIQLLSAPANGALLVDVARMVEYERVGGSDFWLPSPIKLAQQLVADANECKKARSTQTPRVSSGDSADELERNEAAAAACIRACLLPPGPAWLVVCNNTAQA
jgi:hypothetical protein